MFIKRWMGYRFSGLAILLSVFMAVFFMGGVAVHAANLADYLPLNSSTRILVTTVGDPEDIGKTYVNRVIGTELIGTTLTTKGGVSPDPEPGGPDRYDSFFNLTNDGISVKYWGNQDITINPPLSFGSFNDGDIIPAFSSNITERATSTTTYRELMSPQLIDIRDVTVSGVTYPSALIMYGMDPDLPVIDLNFGTNTLGFPATYSPNANGTLPGAISAFSIYASGVGSIAEGDIDARTGNFIGLIELKSVLANPLVGTWGYGRLGHKNSGEWSTRGGKITFDLTSGTDTSQYNNNGTIGTAVKNFIYYVIPNQDGSLTVVYVYQDGTTDIERYVLSDDGKVLIMDGTDPGDKQRFRVAVRLDTSKTYTNADLTGDYYAIDYGHDVNGTPYFYNGSSGGLTFDGAGNWIGNFTENHDGTIWTGSNNSAFSVNADGSLIFNSNVLGYLSGDGRLGFGTGLGSVNSWSEGILMKRGDRTYSTADLAGTWALAAFGDVNGNIYFSGFGSITCDNSGTCEQSFNYQWDGNISHHLGYFFGAGPVAIDGDGSFGTYLGDLAPSYAGAIGNNGNTIILNASFDSGNLNQRLIFVGLRCSYCSDLTTLQTWFEEADPAVAYTGTWNPVTGCTLCSGGGYDSSGQTGATAELSFSGRGFKWFAYKDNTMGKAKVYLDGVYQRMVDLYSRNPRVEPGFEMMGIAPGNHTLTIEVSGKKNRKSAGYTVNIDAFEIVP